MEFYRGLQIKTAKEAVYHPNASIVAMKKELIDAGKGEMMLNAFITSMVTDLVLFFNVGKTMNTSQVVQVVEFIKTDYYFLKPSEIRYCFDNAKKGKYGKLYDRIDGTIIFDWIEQYLLERLDTVVSDNEKKSEEYKKNIITDNLPLLELISDISPLEEPKTEIKDNAPKRELNEGELKIQALFKEFDRIWEQDEKTYGGKRFVDFEGKIMDQEEFVSYNLKKDNPF